MVRPTTTVDSVVSRSTVDPIGSPTTGQVIIARTAKQC